MSETKRLNIRQALENSAQEQDVSRLQNAGVRKVKVLDERALLEMIERAVDEVVHTQTADERSRILADSRAQLKKLMDERDQIQSQAHLAEAGRNELLQTIEKLQNEIRLRREVSDQESALAKKSAEL
ncbi:MAG TPA: hypothetical protein VEJ18_09110, partial [Planctomycetota bacterium]|nr:hypothetical protein [Planctomycetota bacterium]